MRTGDVTVANLRRQSVPFDLPQLSTRRTRFLRLATNRALGIVDPEISNNLTTHLHNILMSLHVPQSAAIFGLCCWMPSRNYTPALPALLLSRRLHPLRPHSPHALTSMM